MVILPTSSPLLWNRRFANTRRWILSWVSWILSIRFHHTSMPKFSKQVSSLRFSHQNIYEFLISPRMIHVPPKLKLRHKSSSYKKLKLLTCSNSVFILIDDLSISLEFFSFLVPRGLHTKYLASYSQGDIWASCISVPRATGIDLCQLFALKTSHFIFYCTSNRATLRGLPESNLNRTLCLFCNAWRGLLCNVFEIPEGRQLIVGLP
jgi:hypothetical protein